MCELLSNLCQLPLSTGNLCLLFGDLNCNLIHDNALSDFCNIYGFTNLVKDPTCFKSEDPTLVDVFLTNKPRCFSGVLNTDIGLSDFHNLIREIAIT